jgi:glycosyltransferase involved in cell wall biosynthesis
MNLLIIGTLPPPLGGASVSLSQLIATLQRREDLEVQVVNTSGVRGHPFLALPRFFRIAMSIIWKARRADVISLQPVPSGLPYIGPVVWLASRFWRKPLMIRMFGGIEVHEIRGFRGRLAQFFVRAADIYLVETKAMIGIASKAGVRRIEWYPTGRPMEYDLTSINDRAERCKRFVFVGHVKPEKGVNQIIALSGQLPEGVSIDLYGPLLNGMSASDFSNLDRIEYKGVIRADDVLNVLSTYDALMLPSFWPGEGYPGVLFEAMAVGLPIITTRWRSIPELVDDSCGILIEPRSTEALQEAIVRLSCDEQLFQSLRAGAVTRRDLFDANKWAERFVEFCREISNRN